jgi:hypothetical protein
MPVQDIPTSRADMLIQEGKSAVVDKPLKLDMQNATAEQVLNQVAFAFMDSRSKGQDRFRYGDYLKNIPSTISTQTYSGNFTYDGKKYPLALDMPIKPGTAYSESFNYPYRTEQCWTSAKGNDLCSQEFKSSFGKERGQGGGLPSISLRYNRADRTEINKLLLGR